MAWRLIKRKDKFTFSLERNLIGGLSEYIAQ